MKLILLFLLFPFIAMSKERPQIVSPHIDSIFVSKSKKKMILFAKGKARQTFDISIGDNPVGHKIKQGDNRTPEGLYFINDKNPHSQYFKNLGISYPNESDIKKAKSLGVNPGGDIKIHGYVNAKGSAKNFNTRYTATWGCLGMTNADIAIVYYLVKVGTPIFIAP